LKNNRYFSWLICVIYLIDETITGFVTQVSPIKTAKSNNKRKFFDFLLTTNDKHERSVCFSPEKHKLVSEICESKQGCEIKKFKRSDTNDIIVGDYTSVKRTKLDFNQGEVKTEMCSIAYILNESKLFEMVNTKGLVCELGSVQESLDKNGKKLAYVSGTLVDSHDMVPITFYDSLCQQIESDKCFVIKEARVSKFNGTRYLKTTSFSSITPIHDLNIEHKSSTKTVITKATSIDLSSFSEILNCPSCKSDDLDIDEDFTVCKKCHHMSNKEDCIKPSTIKFSINNEDQLIELCCDPKILEKGLDIPVSQKMVIAKKIMSSPFSVTYNLHDKIVKDLKSENEES